MGAPKTPAVTTQISKTELPEFIQNGGQQNLEFANQIAANLPHTYASSNNMVADLNANENSAFGAAANSYLAGQPAMQGGLSTLAGLQSYSAPSISATQQALPSTITAQQVASQNATAQNAGWDAVSTNNIGYDRVGAAGVNAQNTRAGNWLNADQSAYMNPYTQQVKNANLAILNQQGKQALNGIGDSAAMAGAFGGSRQGIAEGSQAAQTALNSAQMGAQLDAQNYAQAQSQFNTDSDRRLTSDTNNANRNLQAQTTNASNWLNASLANQSTRLQADTGNAQRSLQAALANQSTGYTANAANADRAYNADRDNANRSLQASLANQSSDLQAQNYNAGYQYQTNTANADRQLNADKSNQSANLAGAQLASQAASSAITGGQQATQSWLQSAAAQQAAGDAQRAYQQDLLNQTAAQADEPRQHQIDQLSIRQTALGMTPYGQQTTTTTTQPQQKSSGLMQGLGAFGSIASALTPLFAMSDERTKTDRQMLAVDPATGAPIESYRYKGDPTPRIGSMAQDLQHIPGAVKTGADGLKRIHPAVANTPAQVHLRAVTGAAGPKASFLGTGNGPGLLDGPAPKANAKAPARPASKGGKKLTRKAA